MSQDRVASTTEPTLCSSSSQIDADSSSTTHTGRRSRPAVFPNRTPLALFPIPACASRARGRLHAADPELMRDRRHGNLPSSCEEVPRPMSQSLWPFRAIQCNGDLPRCTSSVVQKIQSQDLSKGHDSRQRSFCLQVAAVQTLVLKLFLKNLS